MADEPQGGNVPAFTEQQVESLRSIVGGIVNATIRKRDEMSDKKRAEDRDAIKGEFAKLLDEKFQNFQPTSEGKEGKEGKRGKGEDVEMATLRQKLSELTQRTEAAERRAAEERAKNRESARQRQINEALGKAGIADEFKKELALSYLDRRQRVQWSGEEDDASLLWNGDDGNQLAFAEGMRSWLKSEEAKHFMPPSNARGSGGRPGTAPIAGNETVSREQAQTKAAQYLAKAIQRELHSGIDVDE